MRDITITWKAFGNRPERNKFIESHTFSIETDATDLQLLNKLYEATNLYNGFLWDAMQPLPETRTHTALSIGDEVQIDGKTWVVSEFGFDMLHSPTATTPIFNGDALESVCSHCEQRIVSWGYQDEERYVSTRWGTETLSGSYEKANVIVQKVLRNEVCQDLTTRESRL